VLDGFRVVQRIAQLAPGVPVIVMSAEPGDLAAAFERGAHDFIAKPFTTDEVIARAWRVARTAALRGSLAAVGLPAVLTMLAHERKTGRLVVTGDRAAWIDLVDGKIVGAGSDQHAD